jgi:site-specific DNA recombinase
MRYASYIRTSTGAQAGNFAVDAQRRAIEDWVAAQAGQLVEVYIDESHAGHTTDRPALQAVLQDARRDEFDALVVHRLDRLARKRADLRVIQSTLDNHHIKLCAVSAKEEYA